MGTLLNFGSVNIDHVYTVPHFVRPGETLASTRYAVFSGGKGFNQAIMAARQGADTLVVERYGCPGGMAVFAVFLRGSAAISSPDIAVPSTALSAAFALALRFCASAFFTATIFNISFYY